jgi:hypothetical protein
MIRRIAGKTAQRTAGLLDCLIVKVEALRLLKAPITLAVGARDVPDNMNVSNAQTPQTYLAHWFFADPSGRAV